jgi:hypothetical protein
MTYRPSSSCSSVRSFAEAHESGFVAECPLAVNTSLHVLTAFILGQGGKLEPNDRENRIPLLFRSVDQAFGHLHRKEPDLVRQLRLRVACNLGVEQKLTLG